MMRPRLDSTAIDTSLAATGMPWPQPGAMRAGLDAMVGP